MKYLSVCSGIEAATVAWEYLGWQSVGFAEIEEFPCAVLTERYGATRPLRMPSYGSMKIPPKLSDIVKEYKRYSKMPSGESIPNFGDFTQITKADTGEFDLLVGGTPCQDFSVAGRQAGFVGEKGNLAYEYVRLLSRTMPAWFIWENVPQVLCGKHKKGFVGFGRQLEKLGYAVGWRVLDGQYARVSGFEKAIPQRRRRLFVVGYLGERKCLKKVLFESERLCWTAQEGGEERVCDAEDAGVRTYGIKSYGKYSETEVSKTLVASDDITTRDLICVHGTQDPVSNSETAYAFGRNNGQENVICIAGNTIGRKEGNGGNGAGYDNSGVSYTMTTADRHAVCYENYAADSRIKEIEVSPVITARSGTGGGNLPLVQDEFVVRTFTPVEVERLFGFPDNYARIPWRGKPAAECPDSHRYKALGNSMMVNVMRLIGKRIEKVMKDG